MATHGCLKIDDLTNKRTITLHTYHTGMDIPQVLPRAFDVLANHYDWVKTLDNPDVDRLMDRSCVTERLEYAPSAAALIIAARPCFLEPVTRGNRKDLPTWSGIDSPFRLTIHGLTWTLRNEEGQEIGKWDVHDELRGRLQKMISEKNDADASSGSDQESARDRR